MKNLLSFFEIPSSDFNRAVEFYAKAFGYELKPCDFEGVKMAFFPKDDSGLYGAVILCEGYEPSPNGVIITFNGGEDLSPVLDKVKEAGGKILVSKCKTGDEAGGYFAIFSDSEGNRIGLYSKN